MRKFTIDSTVFELSDDAAIVLSAYLGRLDFYVAKRRIDADQAARARDYLKKLLLDHLSSGTPLSGKEAQHLATRTEREYPSAPAAERRGIVRRFFAGIAAIFTGVFRALFFLVWTAWRAVGWAVLIALALAFFGLAAGVAWAIAVLLIDPVVGGQAIFGVLPRDISLWSLALLETAFLALALAAVFALWNSPRLWRGFAIVGVLAGFASGNALMYLGMDTLYRYSPRYERVETTRFALGTGTGELTVSGVAPSVRRDGEYHWYGDGITYRPQEGTGSDMIPSYDYSAVQERSDIERAFFTERLSIPSRSVMVEYAGTGSDVEIVTVTAVSAPDEAAAAAYLAEIRPLSYSLSGTAISVDPAMDGSLTRPLPYQGLYRRIYIRLPESARPPEPARDTANTDYTESPGYLEGPVNPDLPPMPYDEPPTDMETLPDSPEPRTDAMMPPLSPAS